MGNRLYNDYMSDIGAMGVYTAANQFDMNPVMMQSLGFTQEEVNLLQFIVLNGGTITAASIANYGIPYEYAKKLKYMYDIATGRVRIETSDDLPKHLKKMFNSHRTIGIQDLALSKVKSVPRKALIAGIPEGPFALFNSINYEPLQRMYDVVDVSSSRITVRTSRKPVLKYKQDRFIEGILEIKEVNQDGTIDIAIDKKYCKLCNRFIIVATLRRPEYHMGLIEIIAIEGTKVYVYAKNMGTSDTINYNGGTQRVYEFGYFASEINIKLKICATELYRQLCGVYAIEVPANQDFKILPDEKIKQIDNELDIEI